MAKVTKATKSTKYQEKMLECAREINASTNEPFIGMVENLALAYFHENYRDQKKFKAAMIKLRGEEKRATMAENRLSESWSIGELGKYKCVDTLFKNIRNLPELPSATGMYDIACSIRGKGSFGKKGLNNGKGLNVGWTDVDRADAPTVEQLQSAMKLANKARNVGKTAKQMTFREYVDNVVTKLTKYQKGEITMRDAKGDIVKNAKGETVYLAAETSDYLTSALGTLNKLKVELEAAAAGTGASNVTAFRRKAKANGRKAA
jgi:hypothetical protein